MSRKHLYWISTALLCALYVASAAMYVAKGDEVREFIAKLGYPAYLREVLIAVKLLGVAAILLRRSVLLSDLAYAGMFFHLLLALSAHLQAHDPGFVPAVLGLVLLAVSFTTQNAARSSRSPHAGSAGRLAPR